MVSDQGLYQLFLHDPNGVKVELNFANSEALQHGIKPELKASELDELKRMPRSTGALGACALLEPHERDRRARVRALADQLDAVVRLHREERRGGRSCP